MGFELVWATHAVCKWLFVWEKNGASLLFLGVREVHEWLQRDTISGSSCAKGTPKLPSLSDVNFIFCKF